MFEYVMLLQRRIDTLINCNNECLKIVIDIFADAILNDKMIHIFGTGHSHMVGLEGFIRAGGLGNINAILDSVVTTSEGALRSSKLEKLSGLAKILWEGQPISAEDIIVVVSNSGRNALPIEFAQIAKGNGHQVIAITSVEQSNAYPSLHHSHQKLLDVADIVLDNYVPIGDGLCNVNGRVTGAFSTVAGVILLSTIVVEAQKQALARGGMPLVFSSQNVDGFNNDDVYAHFAGRLKSM